MAVFTYVHTAYNSQVLHKNRVLKIQAKIMHLRDFLRDV